MIKLDPRWKDILVKAWSLKFTGLSMFFSGLEVFVQMVQPDSLPVPNGVFASLAAVVSMLSGFSRLLAQKELPSAPAKT